LLRQELVFGIGMGYNKIVSVLFPTQYAEPVGLSLLFNEKEEMIIEQIIVSYIV
jgi:hypothetical protein